MSRLLGSSGIFGIHPDLCAWSSVRPLNVKSQTAQLALQPSFTVPTPLHFSKSMDHKARNIAKDLSISQKHYLRQTISGPIFYQLSICPIWCIQPNYSLFLTSGKFHIQNSFLILCTTISSNRLHNDITPTFSVFNALTM